MNRILIATLALSCGTAYAGTYECPQTFPSRDTPAIPLTGAIMMWGERPASGPPFPSGWLTGDQKAAQDGMDVRYELSEPPEPNWLVCQYGSRKRIKGHLRNGHEWGQYMEGHGQEVWFMQLAPKDTDCTVQTREVKVRSANKSTWTVTASCRSH